ncbi:MAG: sialate O-acetylesterase [Candidatus Sumerlaeota bacterium]|nr:sialate O-acetylesterase [Candidatus Sumerlaeota bacterium]
MRKWNCVIPLTLTVAAILTSMLLRAADDPAGATFKKATAATAATAAAAAAAAAAAPAVDLGPREKFHLYLLIGQSNMAGRGIIEEQDKKIHPRMFMLDREDQWVPAKNPLHFDKPGVAGVGLGFTFGTIMADADPTIKVGLIPSAFGGTSILSWERNSDPLKGQSVNLYQSAVKRARIAMKSGVLKGILWHQGEADGRMGAKYAEKLAQLVKNLREDLNAPDARFVAGFLGEWNSDAGHMAVNEAIKSLPTLVPNTGWVDSKFLTNKPNDTAHFTAASLREYGRRYAIVFQGGQPELKKP